MPWSFAGETLEVRSDPRPSHTAGYAFIVHRAPGVSGITAVMPDRRTEEVWSFTVQCRDYNTYQTLHSLFAAGTQGTFEVPENGDHWVYAEAFVSDIPQWEQVLNNEDGEGTLWRARIEITCPIVPPTWKSTGYQVLGV